MFVTLFVENYILKSALFGVIYGTYGWIIINK